MKRSRFTDSQIMEALKRVEADAPSLSPRGRSPGPERVRRQVWRLRPLALHADAGRINPARGLRGLAHRYPPLACLFSHLAWACGDEIMQSIDPWAWPIHRPSARHRRNPTPCL
jgi:hypothetical protein